MPGIPTCLTSDRPPIDEGVDGRVGTVKLFPHGLRGEPGVHSSFDLLHFYRTAHQHHPDKSGGDDAKFKELNQAYQVLGNAEKRRQYDQFGPAYEQMGGFGGGPGGFGQGYDNKSDSGDASDNIRSDQVD